MREIDGFDGMWTSVQDSSWSQPIQCPVMSYGASITYLFVFGSMSASDTTPSAMQTPHSGAVYNTPAGHDLVWWILVDCLPHLEPHDYQLNGVCFALDGDDVAATMATGARKTSFLNLSHDDKENELPHHPVRMEGLTSKQKKNVILFSPVLERNSLPNYFSTPERWFECHVACYLHDIEGSNSHAWWCNLSRGLQWLLYVQLRHCKKTWYMINFAVNFCFALLILTQGAKMTLLGLPSLVINSDTCSEAQKSGRDLWVEAQTWYTMIFLSPEELTTWSFTQLLEQKEFLARVCMLGVDEIHLLHWWGKSFQLAFWQISTLHAHLPKIRGWQLPVMALTATLWAGSIMGEVTKILGLSPGHYHLICWSDMLFICVSQLDFEEPEHVEEWKEQGVFSEKQEEKMGGKKQGNRTIAERRE